MPHRNFCFLLFLIKCFIRNWFGLGVNLIFIINAYIIFWANLMASVYAFIFCQSSCHHNMMMEWIGALKIWSRGVSLKWLSTNRSIGTPSEKLKPNQIWADIVLVLLAPTVPPASTSLLCQRTSKKQISQLHHLMMRANVLFIIMLHLAKLWVHICTELVGMIVRLKILKGS